METPYTGRAILIENADSLEIIIPAKKNTLALVYALFWTFAWLAAEVIVISIIFGVTSSTFPKLYTVILQCLILVGGISAGRIFWWSFKGEEIIVARQGVLTINRKGLLFYKLKIYDLKQAKNFRARESTVPYFPFGRSGPGFRNTKIAGTIGFTYGLKTVKFADEIDEAEANFILEKLSVKKLIESELIIPSHLQTNY